jgi:hypothetical protein
LLRVVLFAPASRGQLALVVFEWEDAKYLGMDPSGENKLNDWQSDVSYLPPFLLSLALSLS